MPRGPTPAAYSPLATLAAGLGAAAFLYAAGAHPPGPFAARYAPRWLGAAAGWGRQPAFRTISCGQAVDDGAPGASFGCFVRRECRTAHHGGSLVRWIRPHGRDFKPETDARHFDIECIGEWRDARYLEAKTTVAHVHDRS